MRTSLTPSHLTPVTVFGHTLFENTPVQQAILTRNFEQLEDLIAKGIDPHQMDASSGLTLMHLALADDVHFLSDDVHLLEPSFDMAKRLLELGAQPEQADHLGQTPQAALNEWEQAKWRFTLEHTLSTAGRSRQFG